MQILIIDDNSTSLKVFAAIVGKIDRCTPVCFDHPAKAMSWLETETPDLILLDQVMPEVDGLSFLARMRSRPRLSEVPVVMVTASDAFEVRLAALEGGATDFITKPIQAAEFQARIRNLMSLRESQLLLQDRAAHLAHEVRVATQELRDRELELVIRLCRAAEFRDAETGAHIERMSRYARLIGEALGDSPEACEHIFLAAPMHDIGKLGIPDLILLKPGRLNGAELSVMQSHTAIGHALLADSRSPLLKLGAEIALSHHEKWDGSGYPNQLAGTAISRAGRIVAVADVFDALTTPRPYKQAWSTDRAHEFILANRGSHFDPDCVDAFLLQWDRALAVMAQYEESGR